MESEVCAGPAIGGNGRELVTVDDGAHGLVLSILRVWAVDAVLVAE